MSYTLPTLSMLYPCFIYALSYTEKTIPQWKGTNLCKSILEQIKLPRRLTFVRHQGSGFPQIGADSDRHICADKKNTKKIMEIPVPGLRLHEPFLSGKARICVNLF